MFCYIRYGLYRLEEEILLLVLRKQNPCCELLFRKTMVAGNCTALLVLRVASSWQPVRIRALVTQIEGNEFHQQLNKLRSRFIPVGPLEEHTAWLAPWLQLCETPSRGPSYTMLRLLSHGSCEIINVCFKLLSLW